MQNIDTPKSQPAAVAPFGKNKTAAVHYFAKLLPYYIVFSQRQFRKRVMSSGYFLMNE